MSAPMMNLDLDKTKGRDRTAVLAVVVPALFVLGFLALLIVLRRGAEGGMARLAALLPVSYAFSAGMVASANPCGVLMLPTYVLYQLGTSGEDRHIVRRATQGLLMAVVVTLGFILVFSLVGGVIVAGGRWLVTIFPYAGLIIGVGMAVLGLWLLIGHRTLGIAAAGRLRLTPKRNLGNIFLFGVVYAIGSLSCTLPIFLVVVGSALAGSRDIAASFGPFLAYSGGMGAVILVVTLGAAVFHRGASRWLDRFTPYVHRFSAFFLIGSGLYLVYYWIFVGDLI